MHTTMKHTLVVLAFISSVSLHGQYTFNTFIEPYEELGAATEIPLDDDWGTIDFTLPIGFAFGIGGETYTNMVQAGPGANFVFPTSSGSNEFGYFSALANGAAIGASPSVISYTTEGEAGERICKLQYANTAFEMEVYGPDATAQSRVNFQVWLYESNDAIEFRFGENTIDANSQVHGPSPGPLIILALDLDLLSGTFDYAVILSGDPSNPTTETPVFGSVQDQLTGQPDNGRVYQFLPTPTSAINTNRPHFSIYPTIADRQLIVDGDVEPLSAYRIYSIEGRLVQSGALSTKTLEIGDLPQGLYVLQLGESGNGARFIKK